MHQTDTLPIAPPPAAPFPALLANAAPKLLVAKEDESALPRASLGQAILVITVAAGPDGGFELAWPGGGYRPPEHPPYAFYLHNVLGLAAFSAAGAEILGEFLERRPTLAPGGAVERFLPAKGAAPVPAFLAWLQDAVCAAEVVLAGRNCAYQRELSLLRRQQEELQDNFIELERYLYEIGSQPKLVFGLEPTPFALEVPRDVPPGHWITQELPVSSHGLTAVSLHLPESDGWGQGRFLAELFAHESSEVLERFDVPFGRLVPGWNTLALSRSLAGRPPESLTLRLCWHPDTTRAPGISLGPLNPVPEACVTLLDSLRQPRRPLAMRLYAGPPGVRLTHFAGVIYPAAATAEPDKLTLPGWLLERAEKVSPPVPEAGMALVLHVKEDGDLQVHPLEGYTAIARLPGVCPPGTMAATADIRTASPKGPVIEYAMAVLPQGAPFDTYFHGDKTAPEPGFSGWVRLPPDTPTQIHVQLPRPLTEPGDVYAATRLAPGQPSHYGWARYSNFVFSSRPLGARPRTGGPDHAARS